MGWAVLAAGVALGTLAVRAVLPNTPRSMEDASAAADAAAAAAIEVFEERHAKDPHNYVLAARLTDRYLSRFALEADLRDLEKAERIAELVAAHAPRRAPALARLSRVRLARHDFSGAYAAAHEASELEPNSSLGWAVLYDAAMASGFYEEAQQALERMETGTTARHLRHARWLAFSGRTEAAFDAMAKACREIRMSNLRPQVAAWCLTELADLGRDKAVTVRLLKLALETKPGYRGALERLADEAAANQDLVRAADLYEQIAVDAHPDLYLRLAEVYRSLGLMERAAQAEDRFRRASGDTANETLYAHSIAVFLARTDDTRDSAVSVIERDLTRRRPNESYEVLAWVQYLDGNLEQAAKAVERAKEWGAPSATVEFIDRLIRRSRDGYGFGGPDWRGLDIPALEPHVREYALQRFGDLQPLAP